MPSTDRRTAADTLVWVVLGLGALSAGLVVVALSARVLQIRTTALTPTFPVGDWVIGDLGSNLPTAAVLSALGLAAGLLGFGLGRYRWAAGLIAGSALAILGWSALVLGLMERPISAARSAVTAAAPVGTEAISATIQRSAGSTLVILAGLCALATAAAVGIHLRPDPRGGLNPWIAALGAVAAMGTTIGPLLPVSGADLAGNLTVDPGQPAAVLIGRLVHLGLIAVCGVGGFLLVRTAGLGVVAGNLLLVGWLTASSVLDVGALPVGPGYANPGGFAAGFAVGEPGGAEVDIHLVTSISVIAMTVILLAMIALAVVRGAATEPVGAQVVDAP